MAESPTLFLPDTPPGFHFRDDFISPAEERSLVSEIDRLAFANFEFRGVVARRRVAFFGATYDQDGARPIPQFLLPLRTALAEWAQVESDAFAMTLINEYRPGTPIGWHRDAPQYAMVAGLSLASACRMKLRPYVAPRALHPSETRTVRRATHELTLPPRSAYLLTGPARSAYEHSIPPVESLRYSITFRTLRAGARPAP